MENQKNLHPPRERIADREEEEEEEMKMETFFALLRNFKEMRDRRRKELMIGDGDETAAEKNRKRMKAEEAVQNRSTWIPKFEKEDFDEDFQVRGPALVLPKPCNLVKKETAAAMMKKKEKKKAKNGDDCLDLNLAL